MTDTPIQLCIDAAHPALPGHFPGQPIVPGVVLLDSVVAALADFEITVTGVRKLKFLAPLPPGEPVELELGAIKGDSLRFKLRERASDTLIAEGNLDLTSRGEA